MEVKIFKALCRQFCQQMEGKGDLGNVSAQMHVCDSGLLPAATTCCVEFVMVNSLSSNI